MTREEKAKAYDEALKLARDYRNDKNCFEYLKGVLENLFPELKESEDEKIRKSIIHLVNAIYNGNKFTLPEFGKDLMLKWLDKQKPTESLSAQEAMDIAVEKCFNQGGQMKTPEESLGIDSDTYNEIVDECIYGEHKPIDKVEPKFKVGDWVVCEVTGSVYQIKNCIENISNHRYGYELTDGGYIGSDEVNNYHLWTIQDAKDGDVLCYESKYEFRIFIYKNGHIHYHCHYCNGHLTTVDSFFIIEKYLFCYVHPATKEQRNLLFQKIKEAGYEWDEDKKELRRLEKQKPIDAANEKWQRNIREEIIKYLDVQDMIAGGKDKDFKDWIAWLEKQKSVEWSEEDDAYKLFVISAVKDYYNETNPLQKELVNWLKSLKERYTWKPSDEQIKAIRLARSFVVDDFGEHPTLSEILMELEEQLQKIKENKQ